MTAGDSGRIDQPLTEDEVELLERVAETNERGDLAERMLANADD